jgi:hypothetical protein
MKRLIIATLSAITLISSCATTTNIKDHSATSKSVIINYATAEDVGTAIQSKNA